MDGDSVTIPKAEYNSVVGEVLNPISFEFDEKTSLTDAVLRAGNLRDYADKSQIYVIRANGMIERPNRNIFMGTIRVEGEIQLWYQENLLLRIKLLNL